MLDEYLTTKEASEYSGLSQPQIQYLLRNGKLLGLRKGRMWLVSRADIDKYMVSDRKPGPRSVADADDSGN